MKSCLRSLCWWALLSGVIGCCGNLEAAAAAGSALPHIFPDYAGIVIPPNIAPLNFTIEEQGTRFRVVIRGEKGNPIELQSSSAGITIPAKNWRALLQANLGTNVCMQISVMGTNATWTQFSTITNFVAAEPIDGYLVYRRLKPIFNVYSTLGVFQRDLTTFEERAVLRNRTFDDGCLNCHTFLNRRTEQMTLNIRGPQTGNPMLLVQSNHVAKVEKTAGYMSWHPSGRLIAYSTSKLTQFFHTTGPETRDVYDGQSNLGIYRVDQNRVVVPPVIARPDRQENWPSWSPDGKYLYFCSAPVLPLERSREVRYDLLRVSYDIDSDTWGEPEVLVSAAKTGLSSAQPRVSPDGRYVVFCMFHHGHFPIYQRSSDLFMIDLNTRQLQCLDAINSPEADTWHCWSDNGRWMVFSSKRRDGLFARPYFSYFSREGKFSKPLMLPQEDPGFYDSFVETFNVPEFVTEPVPVSESELAEAINKPRLKLTPVTDTNASAVGAPGAVDAAQPEQYQGSGKKSAR